MPNPSIVALIVSEISALIRTDGQTDMARSTRLVILIKNKYTLWGRKRFLLPVAYFPTNIVYPSTLFFCLNKRSTCAKLVHFLLLKKALERVLKKALNAC